VGLLIIDHSRRRNAAALKPEATAAE